MAKSKTAKISTGNYDYETLSVRGKDGKIHYSRGNGDAIHKSMLLHVAGGGTMKQIIDANNLDIDAKNTNMGLVRMSVGVALRAAVRAGEAAKVGKIVVRSLKQSVPLPKVEKKVAAAKPKAAKKAKAKKSKRSAKPKAAAASETVQEAPAQ